MLTTHRILPKAWTLNRKPYTMHPNSGSIGRGERPVTRRGSGGNVDALLNPTPHTINPEPCTQNPKPYTLVPESASPNPKTRTLKL